jgi:acyl-coenzyme A thioesterase PaaI-like protein
MAGPFFFPPAGRNDVCGFLADARHGNTRDVVHGGMLATAFDFALGTASLEAAGQRHCATVQLNVHFIAAMNLGEFAIIRCETVRTTRSLVFLRAMMTVGDRTIATADGVWKILEWRG